MSRSRLVPGAEVVAVPGRGLALRTPDGEFLRVRAPEGEAEAVLLTRLAGRDTGRPDAEGSGELARVVAAFEGAGYLADDCEPPRWPDARRDVLLLGDPVLTTPLAGQLAALGARPRTADDAPAALRDLGLRHARDSGPQGPADDASRDLGLRHARDSGPQGPADDAPAALRDLTEAAPAAVVWCLDGPVPDGLWDAADRLPERGVAWLRCHREGWHAYVEPLAAAPGDVTAAHVRGRRLAATPAHRELAAYWSGPRTRGATAGLTPPAASLVASFLADDLHRWATGVPHGTGLPATRRLRRVDLRTLTVTEHPVLPVPAVATRTGRDG